MKLDADRKATILFSAVLLAGLLGGLAWYVVVTSGYRTFQIHTSDAVSGLIVDSPVEFHGVEVGRVKKVELLGPRSVRVLLAVKDDAPVTKATVATITSRGLATHGFTGYVYVALEDEGVEAGPLEAAGSSDYPVIPTAASKSVNLDLAIAEVNRNVEALTGTLLAALDPKTVASLKLSADSLQRMSSALEKQVLPQAHGTLSRLDDLATSMSGVASKLNRDPSVLVRGPERRKPGPGEEGK